MRNTEDLKAQADYEFKADEQNKMIGRLKEIKRTTFETKKLMVQYGVEADEIARRVTRDLKILETM